MVMLSVLPPHPSSRDVDSFRGSREERAQGAVGVILSYRDFPGAPIKRGGAKRGDSGLSDDDFVYVSFHPEGTDACSGNNCVMLKPLHGSTIRLSWLTAASENYEGPGSVSVSATHPDGSVVSVTPSFRDETITGDPREQTLTLGVAQMRALVGEPRIGRFTDQGLVSAGQELPEWDSIG